MPALLALGNRNALRFSVPYLRSNASPTPTPSPTPSPTPTPTPNQVRLPCTGSESVWLQAGCALFLSVDA